jgi:hypothetical protein
MSQDSASAGGVNITATRLDVVGRVALGLVGVVAASPFGAAPVALGVPGLVLAVGVQVLGLVAMSRAFRSHAASTLVGTMLALYWGVACFQSRHSRFDEGAMLSWLLMQQIAIVAVFGVVGLWRPGGLVWRRVAAGAPLAILIVLLGFTIRSCR